MTKPVHFCLSLVSSAFVPLNFINVLFSHTHTGMGACSTLASLSDASSAQMFNVGHSSNKCDAATSVMLAASHIKSTLNVDVTNSAARAQEPA